MASNGVTRPPALDVTMQEILDALKAVSFRPQVIDNLTSQDTGAPLSANQGRVLKSAIDGLVTQSITDGDTAHAPSGDAVHDALNAINGKLGAFFWHRISRSDSAHTYRLRSLEKNEQPYLIFGTYSNSPTLALVSISGGGTAGVINLGSSTITASGVDATNIDIGIGAYMSVMILSPFDFSVTKQN